VIGPDDDVCGQMIARLEASGRYAEVVSAANEEDARAKLPQIQEQYTLTLVVDCTEDPEINIAASIARNMKGITIMAVKTRDPNKLETKALATGL
jgi:hypothetical protein